MTELWLVGLLGGVLGSWRMRTLRREAVRLVHGGGPASARLLLQTLALRSAVALLFAAALAWSLPALVAVAGGYWLGRSVQLILDVTGRGWVRRQW